MVKVGSLIFGFTLIILSLHPVLTEVVGWAIPINEQSERPLFASLFLVLAGLGFVAYGSFTVAGTAGAGVKKPGRA